MVAWSTFHSTRPVHAAVAVGGFGMLLVERRSGGRHWLVEREERATLERAYVSMELTRC